MTFLPCMHREFSLIDEFELTGKWWLPDNPDVQLYGILKFKRNYIILEVSGIFNKIHIFQLIRSNIMHGCTDENKKVTLCSVSERHFEGARSTESDSNRNLGKSTFSCKYIFIGRHYDKLEDIKFASLGMYFTYLDKWINNKIECKHLGDGKYNLDIKSLKYELYLEHIESTLYISSIPPILMDSQTDIEVHFTSGIWIKPNKVMNWMWFQDFINNMKNFLTILMGHPVYPVNLLAEPLDCHNYEDITICYAVPDPLIYKDLQSCDIDIPFHNLIKYSNNSSRNIAETINNWFIKLDLIGPVLDLFFLTFYDSSMKPYLRFLTLMQALEIFHRRVCGGKYLSQEDYKPIREALIKAIPDNLEPDPKQNLVSKIGSGNEFPLKMRLKKLLNYSPFKYFWIIAKYESGEPEEFIGKLVNTRNYYTHFNESPKKPIFSDKELYRINSELRVILRVFLLNEIDSKGLYASSNIFSSFFSKLKEKDETEKFENNKINNV